MFNSITSEPLKPAKDQYLHIAYNLCRFVKALQVFLHHRCLSENIQTQAPVHVNCFRYPEKYCFTGTNPHRPVPGIWYQW